MHAEMLNKIEIICDFAKKMGYEAIVDQFRHIYTGRPVYSIELIGTVDSNGYPYCWAWYTDTWEEVRG